MTFEVGDIKQSQDMWCAQTVQAAAHSMASDQHTQKTVVQSVSSKLPQQSHCKQAVLTVNPEILGSQLCTRTSPPFTSNIIGLGKCTTELIRDSRLLLYVPS